MSSLSQIGMFPSNFVELITEATAQVKPSTGAEAKDIHNKNTINANNVSEEGETLKWAIPRVMMLLTSRVFTGLRACLFSPIIGL